MQLEHFFHIPGLRQLTKILVHFREGEKGHLLDPPLSKRRIGLYSVSILTPTSTVPTHRELLSYISKSVSLYSTSKISCHCSNRRTTDMSLSPSSLFRLVLLAHVFRGHASSSHTSSEAISAHPALSLQVKTLQGKGFRALQDVEHDGVDLTLAYQWVKYDEDVDAGGNGLIIHTTPHKPIPC